MLSSKALGCWEHWGHPGGICEGGAFHHSVPPPLVIIENKPSLTSGCPLDRLGLPPLGCSSPSQALLERPLSQDGVRSRTFSQGHPPPPVQCSCLQIRMRDTRPQPSSVLVASPVWEEVGWRARVLGVRPPAEAQWHPGGILGRHRLRLNKGALGKAGSCCEGVQG